MRKSAFVPALAAVTVLALAGCGSNDKKKDEAAPEGGTCPTAAPAADAKADWTLTGTTGSVSYTHLRAPDTVLAPAFRL